MEIRVEEIITVVKIIIIDILLSGDNAIIIAMATLQLDHKNRKRGIFFGTCGAIILRILLTGVAAYFLTIPFVQLLGGLVLIWITTKLLIEASSKENKDLHVDSPTRLINAIKIIIIADFSMSTDNILAISGASHGDINLLVFGLLFSIPILMFFSQKIANFMDSYPFLVYIGAVILSMVAGEIIFSDKFVAQYVNEPLSLLLTVLMILCILVASKIKIYRY